MTIFERALVLLEKAHNVMDHLFITYGSTDWQIVILLYINMAACYQNLNKVPEAIAAIENALWNFKMKDEFTLADMPQRIWFLELETQLKI